MISFQEKKPAVIASNAPVKTVSKTAAVHVKAKKKVLLQLHVSRVEATLKEKVSPLRFSLSQSPFFVRDVEQNFCPQYQYFATPWMRATKLRVCKLADAVHGKRRTLNKCSKQGFISISFLVIVALIHKVVCDLFQNFHLINASIWFRCQMNVLVCA